MSTFLPDEYCEARPETVGFAAPVVEVDLADVDDVSGVGELLIRGQNIVAGYWNKPEQTAETFVDGWLHTGDLARVDDDGFVQIVDRKKDMVNRGGENVYCVEVENALVAHPAVFEVAVVGVPDEMMGEKVGAIVVLHPGTELDRGRAHRVRPRAAGRLQGPAVRGVPRRAAAPQPGRQGAQADAAQGDRVGAPGPLTPPTGPRSGVEVVELGARRAARSSSSAGRCPTA